MSHDYEWSKKAGGMYTVADQSVGEVQRRYFAEAVAVRLPRFSAVNAATGTGHAGYLRGRRLTI